MTDSELSKYLNLLQENPRDERIFVQIEQMLRSNEGAKASVEGLREAFEKALAVHESRAEWLTVAKLLEVGLDWEANTLEARIYDGLRAASIHHHKRFDFKKALGAYKTVLELDAQNADAQKGMDEIASLKNDWRNLIEGKEGLENSSAKKQGTKKSSSKKSRKKGKVKQKTESALQKAVLVWNFDKQNVDAAEKHLLEVLQLDADHTLAILFFADVLSTTSQWSKASQVLTNASEHTKNAPLKLGFSIAALEAWIAAGDEERAAKIGTFVLEKIPSHALATQVVAEKAARESNWQAAEKFFKEALSQKETELPTSHQSQLFHGLVDILKRGRKWNAFVEACKEWEASLPDDEVEKRIEILLEIAEVYQEKLQLNSKTISTYQQILKLDPKNTDALEQLISIFEKSEKPRELVKALTQRAEAEGDVQSAIKYWEKVAEIHENELKNLNKAASALECIFAMDPLHQKSFEKLRSIYENKRSWKPLAHLLQGVIDALQEKNQQVEVQQDSEKIVAMKEELARLCTEKLHDFQTALSLWKDLAHEASFSELAQEKIEMLAEKEKDWPALVEALESRLTLAEDSESKMQVLSKLAKVYSSKLGDSRASARTLEQLVILKPEDRRARRELENAYVDLEEWSSLEALYLQGDDMKGFASLLSRVADKAEDPIKKIEVSFLAVDAWETKVEQPQRAARDLERILETDPENLKASLKIIGFFEKGPNWPLLARGLEVVIKHDQAQGVEEVQESQDEGFEQRLSELCSVLLEKTKEFEKAFAWGKVLFDHHPSNPDVRGMLEKAAQALGKSEELVSFYQERLADCSPPDQLSLRRIMASVLLGHLGQTEQATRLFETNLEQDPTDDESVQALDRIYRMANRYEDLKGLLELRLSQEQDDANRCQILTELSQVEEEQIGNAEGAIARLKEVVEIDSANLPALQALSRLAKEQKKWELLASVLEKRAILSEDIEKTHDLRIKTAKLFIQYLDRPYDAFELLANVISEDGENKKAINALEQLSKKHSSVSERADEILEPIFESQAQYEALSLLLVRIIRREEDEQRRFDTRKRLAEIYDGALKQPEKAFSQLEAAFMDKPEAEELWDSFEEYAQKSDSLELVAEAFLTSAEYSEHLDETTRARLLLRAAKIHLEPLQNQSQAVGMLEKALLFEPDSEEIFSQLESYYLGERAWSSLERHFQWRIDQAESKEVKAELYCRKAKGFLSSSTDEDAEAIELSIKSFVHALDLEPAMMAPFEALKALYAEKKKWNALEALLQNRLSFANDDELAELHFELGEICFYYLEKKGEALDHFESALGFDGSHGRTIEFLKKVLDDEDAELKARAGRILVSPLEEVADWVGLRDALFVLADTDTAAEMKAQYWQRIASLEQEQLDDPKVAVESLQKAILASPTLEADSVFENFEMLAKQTDQVSLWEKTLFDVLPQLQNEPHLEGRVCLSLGEHALLQEQHDSAADFFEQCVEGQDAEPDVRQKAARLLFEHFFETLDRKRLVSPLLLLCEFEEQEDERAKYCFALGSVFENIENDTEAIESYQNCLVADPVHQDALQCLIRLYQKSALWDEVIETLRRLVEVLDDPQKKKAALIQIADVHENKCEDFTNTIETYLEILGEYGEAEAILFRLKSLYEKTEQWDDMAHVLGRLIELSEDQSKKNAFSFEFAECVRLRLKEPERGFEILESILENDPNHIATLDLLRQIAFSRNESRLDAAKVLARTFKSNQDFEPLMEVLEVLFETDDPFEKTAFGKQAIEVSEVGLEDLDKAFEWCGRLLKSIAVQDSPDLDAFEYALSAFKRIGNEVQNWEQYISVLEQASADALDESLQISLLFELAEAIQQHRASREKAIVYFERIVEIDPINQSALDALDDLFHAFENPQKRIEVLKRKVELQEDAIERARLLEQIAMLHRQTGDISDAILDLEQALSDNDQDEGLFSQLAVLYEEKEQWAELEDLYRKQLDLALGDRAAILLKQAKVLHENLQESVQAVQCCRLLIEENRENIDEAVGLLERILRESLDSAMDASLVLVSFYESQSQWLRLIAVLEKQVEVSDEPHLQKDALLQVGQIQLERLSDLQGAFNAYEQLFRLEPEEEENWDVLSGLARKTDNWGALAELWQQSIEQGALDDEKLSKLSLMLGAVYESQLSNVESAIQSYQTVLQIVPTEFEAFSSLERLYLKQEKWNALRLLYTDFAIQLDDEVQKIDLLFKLADVQREKLHALEDAENSFREILLINPTDALAQEKMAALFEEQNKWLELTDHLRFCAENSETEQQSLDWLQYLGEVFFEHLGQPEEAIDTFEEILNRDPHQTKTIHSLEKFLSTSSQKLRAAKILEGIYQEENDWQKLIVGLEAQIDSLSEEPEEQSRLHQQVAELYEQESRDLQSAFDHRADALVCDPFDDSNAQALKELNKKLRNWGKKIEVNQKVIQKLGEDTVSEPFYSEIAELKLDMLGDLRSASDTFEKMIGLDYCEADYRAAQEQCLLLLGDWEKLSERLVLHASVEDDPDARIEKRVLASVIFEQELEKLQRAIELYEKNLAENPEHEVSLFSLRRLYREVSKWNELAQVLEILVTLDLEENKRKDVLFELGGLRKNQIRDYEGAFEAFREIAESHPEDEETTKQLHELLEEELVLEDVDRFLEDFYREHGRYSDLAALLTRRADHVASDQEKADLYREVSSIIFENLDDEVQAIEFQKKAVLFQPEDESLFDELESMVEKSGHWEALRGFVEKVLQAPHESTRDIDEQVKYTILLRASEWYEHKLQDISETVQALNQAISVLPQEAKAHEEKIRLLRGQMPDSEVLFEALMATKETDVSEEDQRQFFAEAAVIAEEKIEDLAKAILALNALLEFDSEDVHVLEKLANLHVKAGSAKEAERVFRLWMDAEPDPEKRKRARHQFAAFLKTTSAGRDKAMLVFEEIFDEDPGDIVAYEELDNFYSEKKQWQKTRELYERRLSVLEREEAVEVRKNLAKLLHEQMDDRSEAILVWRDILDASSNDSQAVEHLEKLYAQEGDWYGLIDLFESQAEQAVIREQMDIEISWLERMVVVYREKMQDMDASLDVLGRISDRQPDHPGALRAMARIYEIEKDWEQVVDHLDRAWRKAEAEDAVQDVLQSVKILNEHLENSERAFALLEDAAQAGVVSAEILEQLSQRYAEDESWDKWVDVQKKALGFDTSVQKQALRNVHIARVQREKIEKENEAADSLEQALSLDPRNSEALVFICELYPKMDRAGEAIEILSGILDESKNEKPKVRAQYFQLLGFLYAQIDLPEKAFENLEQAYKLDVSSVSILRDFGMLAYQNQKFQESQKALRTLLIKRFDPDDLGMTKADIYYYLGEMAYKEKQNAKAKSLLQKALAEDSNHEQSISLLDELENL